MQKYIFKQSEYKSYKDFYRDIAKKLDAKNDMNCLEPEDLGFSADILYEFLEDYYDENIKLILVGFDLEKIDQRKTHEDYKTSLIIEVMREFVEKYPNNTIEFREE